jgi:hypothetical protein
LLLAFWAALLEVGLEGRLVVEGHRAETSSFEEKIKIHILLISSSLWILVIICALCLSVFLLLFLSLFLSDDG